jgi:hypothetical protein
MMDEKMGGINNAGLKYTITYRHFQFFNLNLEFNIIDGSHRIWYNVQQHVSLNRFVRGCSGSLPAKQKENAPRLGDLSQQ